MRAVHVSIRRIGNSHGVREVGAEMTVEDGALVLRRPAIPARAGWAVAAQKIGEAGGEVLVMGEFGNTADSDLVW